MTEPYELTIAQAAAEIRAGTLSPVDLMDSLLERSRSLDPQLNVWVNLDEDAARAAAAESARQLADGEDIGPLHGIPFAVKDIYYTKGVETTGCSKVYAGFVPDYDSTAVVPAQAGGRHHARKDRHHRVRHVRAPAYQEPLELRPHTRRFEQRLRRR